MFILTRQKQMAETEVDLSGELDAAPLITPSSGKRWMALSFNTNAREWVQKRRESVRPWAEFFNFAKYKIPKAVAPVGKRVIKNVEKFQSNYLFIFVILVIFCIMTSPLLLIAIGGCFGACYVISKKNSEKPLTIAGKEISLLHQYAAVGVLLFPLFWVAGAGATFFWVLGRELSVTHQYAGVGILSFPLLWIAGAGSAVFWVIGASFFVIMLHASLYIIEDELANIEEALETV